MALHTFDALKSRNFTIYMSGQSIALIGMWVQKLASSWLVYRLTESAFLLGLVELLANAPIFVIGLLAGAWIEKHDIKKLIIAMQILTLLHALILAFLIFFNLLELWHILVLSLYLGVIFAIDMPARQSSLLLLVNQNNELKSAIALHSVMFNLSRFIGPVVAGALIAAYDEGFCFFVTAICYIPVLIALIFVHYRERPLVVRKEQSIFKDIADVVLYCKDVYYMRSMFACFIVVGLFSYSYNVMLPIYAKDILLGDSSTLGFLQGLFGVGAMFGALSVASFVSMKRLPNAIFYLLMLHGSFMVLFALSNNFHLSLFFLFFAGFGMVSHLISTNIYLQSASRPDMRGRVASLYSIGIYGLGPLGAFFAGVFTEHFSPSTTVIVWSAAMLAAGLFFGLRLKRINRELKPVWEEFEKVT